MPEVALQVSLSPGSIDELLWSTNDVRILVAGQGGTLRVEMSSREKCDQESDQKDGVPKHDCPFCRNLCSGDLHYFHVEQNDSQERQRGRA